MSLARLWRDKIVLLTHSDACVPRVASFLFLFCCICSGRPLLSAQHHRDDVVTTLKRVVAGGLAGMLAKSVVAPVDRVKILFQVTNEKFSFKKVGCLNARPYLPLGKSSSAS